MNWRIPLYLIVAGAVGLVALLLSIGQLIMALCITAPVPDSAAGAMAIVAVCSACGFLVVNPFHDAVPVLLVHCWLRLGLLGLESRSIHQRGRIELLQSDLVSVRLLVAARLDSVSALLVRSFLFSSPT